MVDQQAIAELQKLFQSDDEDDASFHGFDQEDLPNPIVPPALPAGAGQDIGTIHNAKWGEMEGVQVKENVELAYQEVVRWRRNIFFLPTGKAGESFIEELTKVINHFNSRSPFESISLMMASIMFPILLQKPSPRAKSADNVKYLDKRIGMWKDGLIKELIAEGKAIQKRISRKKTK